ncbi:hypothetical protein BofuT4_uP009730.1 [Botrytis cinerea T4]|uniref:Uncharacterized protein n=1 Tax=Botryotinia fuckeliana (strain T4) TaxID=999810 RepID=G2XT11_BOTF4|nr:hypothetical protein BofuT4_uP009730.1 [Botrytis cinerea T4]
MKTLWQIQSKRNDLSDRKACESYSGRHGDHKLISSATMHVIPFTRPEEARSKQVKSATRQNKLYSSLFTGGPSDLQFQVSDDVF